MIVRTAVIVIALHADSLFMIKVHSRLCKFRSTEHVFVRIKTAFEEHFSFRKILKLLEMHPTFRLILRSLTSPSNAKKCAERRNSLRRKYILFIISS